MTIDPRRIAIIGFGEVGTTFARGLLASGRHEVTTYDILMEVAPVHSKVRERAGVIGATPSPTAADQIDWAVDLVDNGFSLKGAPDVDWGRRWMPWWRWPNSGASVGNYSRRDYDNRRFVLYRGTSPVFRSRSETFHGQGFVRLDQPGVARLDSCRVSSQSDGGGQCGSLTRMRSSSPGARRQRL